jgi:hypothetical protein
MMKHVGQEVNIEHFFAVLSLSMFSRYSINATFDNVGEWNRRGKEGAQSHLGLQVTAVKIEIDAETHEPSCGA